MCELDLENLEPLINLIPCKNKVGLPYHELVEHSRPAISTSLEYSLPSANREVLRGFANIKEVRISSASTFAITCTGNKGNMYSRGQFSLSWAVHQNKIGLGVCWLNKGVKVDKEKSPPKYHA